MRLNFFRLRAWMQCTFLLLSIRTLTNIAIIRQALYSTGQDQTPPLGHNKVFISCILWNSGAVLRDYWAQTVLDLAKAIGPDNVFVSIYESGSWDDTKNLLRDLDQELASAGIPRKITINANTHQDLIAGSQSRNGWVRGRDGTMRLRRIPYLAQLRNLALQPMFDLALSNRTFDKVLFLNDVMFKETDARALLGTRAGQYAAACSLDFALPPKFYDTFALRDVSGHAAISQHWPFFRARQSLDAVLKGQPVPVSSCWNGMVVMDARPFKMDIDPPPSREDRSMRVAPLRFRGISDGLANHHLEGSECCLIHADNPLSSKYGVWLNPKVRVAYSKHAYETVNPEPRRLWLPTLYAMRALWWNRLQRWTTSSWLSEYKVVHRVRSWERMSSDNVEPGRNCIINEMQVLVGNGWAHV